LRHPLFALVHVVTLAGRLRGRVAGRTLAELEHDLVRTFLDPLGAGSRLEPSEESRDRFASVFDLLRFAGQFEARDSASAVNLSSAPRIAQPRNQALRGSDPVPWVARQLMDAALPDTLSRLREALKAVRLSLELDGAREARRARDDTVAQIDDYLLPRLRQMDAPLLMVVGGSTGAGKSTILNSLVGTEVSPAGVLRPTTRSPVLACHPDDVRWFEDQRILPKLARTTGGSGAAERTLRLVPTTALQPGLALLDSPDIDSVLSENRALANQLLAAADAWLFVTTAARYADAVPWEFLRRARDRGTSLSIVLNRVPEDAREVAAHLREMLREQDLGETELLVVPETQLVDELLPAAALAPVRGWLDGLAADAAARSDLIRRTLKGALASLPARAGGVATAAAEQLAAASELRSEVDTAYAGAQREVEEAMRSGSLLRGEVLARWHEVIGTGDVMRALESRVGWVRDRVKSVLTGKPAADEELRVAVENRIEAVIRAAAERAAERASRAWREHTSGRALLSDSTTFDRASLELEARTEDEVRAWQGFVFELVSREGESKRTTARLASLGVNGAGLTVMLAVFAHTGGLTGAEVVVAGGTSAVGQKVLEAIFGDQAVRTLAARAREDLLERAEQLLRADAVRFDELLDATAPDAESVARLHGSLDAVRRAA
jgi:energy-coupling factor transporter ATP-binding protein EcfA2